MLLPIDEASARFTDAGQVRSVVGSIPARQVGLVDVAAGRDWSLGVSDDGKLFTWGSNVLGRLGRTNVSVSGIDPTPGLVEFPDDQTVVSASAGLDTGIALTRDGGVYTWGRPDIVGGGPTPQRVEFFDTIDDDVVGVSTGTFFYLAWTLGGDLYSWGDASGGRLGRPGDTNSPPALVTAQGIDTRFVSSADAGFLQGLAVVEGEVVVWGGEVDIFGGIDGVTITGLSGDTVTGASIGTNRILFWSSSGQLYTAPGSDSDSGYVPGLNGITGAAVSDPLSAAPGALSFFAWNEAGQLYAWGNNSAGQLGLGDVGPSVAEPTLVALPPDSSPAKVAPGIQHTLYLDQSRSYTGAGANSQGQLGTGEFTYRSSFGTPTPVMEW
ncbi:RCC1 domain-containing protein [Salana multivorans]|uniref:RCC1 domain-containing protein n=1 Tax=Salana multivorans TaxID=120377 RepID=UPI00147366AF|nr:hypothetical protein [Salana multivorans]